MLPEEDELLPLEDSPEELLNELPLEDSLLVPPPLVTEPELER